MYIPDFFVKYWEQITFLILAVSYFATESYKTRLRIIEAKATRIYERKMSCLDNYIRALFDFQKAMNDLPQEVFLKSITGADLDKLTISFLRELQYHDLTIYAHFPDKSYKKINRMTKLSENLIASLGLILKDNSDYLSTSSSFDEKVRIYNNEIKVLMKESIIHS